MNRPEGWGRGQGREVYQRLLCFVEENPGAVVFWISMKDVQRVDISFASETIVELARRFRRTKGFCLVDLTDVDLIENIDAASQKKKQPILMWCVGSASLLGLVPSEGTREAFQFAMARAQTRAADFAARNNISTANASMKFRQLWDQGFLLRQESTANSGGVEYIYYPIK